MNLQTDRRCAILADVAETKAQAQQLDRGSIGPMEHVSYGLFDDNEHAQAAIEGIEASGTARRHLGVTVA